MKETDMEKMNQEETAEEMTEEMPEEMAAEASDANDRNEKTEEELGDNVREEGEEEDENEEDDEKTETEITEEELREFRKLFQKFIHTYKENSEDMSTQEWLQKQLQEEFPDKTQEEVEEMSQEIVDSIEEYDENLQDLNESCAQGTRREQWLADKMEKAATGMAVNEYGNYLNQVDNTLYNANQQMLRTITTSTGEINMCRNLDGFLAEQQQVNSFNAKAALEKSPYQAEVCVPKEGEVYGKDSFDVIIKDMKDNGKRVKQYQFKFGKDSETTIQMLKRGNYNNQVLVVPTEQVEDVQKAFPGKTVVDSIGGTETVFVKADALTKEEVKRMQEGVQERGERLYADYNIYSTKDLALHLGKEAGRMGVQAAVITAGFDMVNKMVNDEPIEADEVVETALRTGADTGVKAAAAGALKVASEKGVLKIIPKGTAASTIANVACVGIENVKILGKVATGELTMSEGLDEMGKTSTAMVYGLSSGAAGTAIGAMALSWIPFVGPVVGGVVGGMTGYMAGSKFGETVYNGAKTVARGLKKAIKKVGKKLWKTGAKLKKKLFGK